MQTDFFATDVDVAQMWRWFFERPGMSVCEVYSRPDLPLRWFEDWEQLRPALNEKYLHLAAWSSSFGAAPRVEVIRFTPETQRQMQAAGRTVLRSPAFINFRRNSSQKGCLATCALSSWTERGARSRFMDAGAADEVNWKALASASGAIVRRLKKDAPGHLGIYPIMPDAWEKFRGGELKLWNAREVVYPSDAVVAK